MLRRGLFFCPPSVIYILRDLNPYRHNKTTKAEASYGLGFQFVASVTAATRRRRRRCSCSKYIVECKTFRASFYRVIYE